MAPSKDKLGEETVDLLTQLVAFPTESRSPNLDLVDFVVSHAEQARATPKVVHGARGRANLFLRFGPEAPGGILVSGHTDVVPAGAGWASDPYVLTSDGDNLRGRGTADMKGFIASALAVAVRQNVSGWRAPLYVGLSYDEEIGCAGVPALLEELGQDPSVDPELVVVGEPTMLSLRTSHAGKVAYTVRAACSSGHSSLASTRTNAIDETVAIAATVAAANRTNGPGSGVSTNVGTVAGGVAVNVLAPGCELTFECRHRADMDPDRVLDQVWSQVKLSRSALSEVDGELEVTRDAQYPALHIDDDDPAVAEVAGVLGVVPAGHLDFGCEAGLYMESLGVPSVVFGPGDIADAHRPNEFVAREQLEAACRSLQVLTNAYCARAHRRSDDAKTNPVYQ